MERVINKANYIEHGISEWQMCTKKNPIIKTNVLALNFTESPNRYHAGQ